MDAARGSPVFVRALAVVLVVGAFALATPTVQRGTPRAGTRAPDAEALLRRAIEAVLPPNTGRPAPRLPRVSLDPTGDLTVVLAIRNGPNAPVIREDALVDTLTILRAVYHAPVASQVRTTTVLGTYAVASATSTRELPVLRAVLSAKHAATLDWTKAKPDQLPHLVDVWWEHPAFAGPTAVGTPAA